MNGVLGIALIVLVCFYILLSIVFIGYVVKGFIDDYKRKKKDEEYYKARMESLNK